MKGIVVAKTIELADAIIIDNNLLIYPSIHEDGGLYYIDIDTESEGLDYLYSFKFFEDDDIEIKDNKFLLLEENSQEFLTVQILTTVKIQ